MIIDTHCHLDFPQFDADRDEVCARALDEDVLGMILIGVDPTSWRSTADLCAHTSGTWRAAGLHPNSVADQWNADLEDELRREAESGDLVAIGETGVDLFRSSETRELQMAAFDAHLALCTQLGLPVVIHQRNAEREVLDILKSYGSVAGVMHCFGGDWDYARSCLDLGLHLGIGGVATYKSAGATRDAVARAPADRLLLETDAPYLAPQPVRGKRNEPAFLRYVVETLASTRDEPAEEIEAMTTRNAVALFGFEL